MSERQAWEAAVREMSRAEDALWFLRKIAEPVCGWCEGGPHIQGDQHSDGCRLKKFLDEHDVA